MAEPFNARATLASCTRSTLRAGAAIGAAAALLYAVVAYFPVYAPAALAAVSWAGGTVMDLLGMRWDSLAHNLAVDFVALLGLAWAVCVLDKWPPLEQRAGRNMVGSAGAVFALLALGALAASMAALVKATASPSPYDQVLFRFPTLAEWGGVVLVIIHLVGWCLLLAGWTEKPATDQSVTP